MPFASAGPPTPAPDSPDWRTHAAWALALTSRLCREGRVDRHASKQAFADAIASHFNCHVMLTVRTSPDSGMQKELERFTSPKVSARSFVESSVDRLAHVMAIPGHKQASLTLRRPVGSPAFAAIESEWLELVHTGCAWLYEPAENGHRLDDLSPREREALGHLMRGASEKEVAAMLGRSRHTVHSYVKRIYRTLGVRSRVELRAILGDAEPLTTSDE